MQILFFLPPNFSLAVACSSWSSLHVQFDHNFSEPSTSFSCFCLYFLWYRFSLVKTWWFLLSFSSPTRNLCIWCIFKFWWWMLCITCKKMQGGKAPISFNDFCNLIKHQCLLRCSQFICIVFRFEFTVICSIICRPWNHINICSVIHARNQEITGMRVCMNKHACKTPSHEAMCSRPQCPCIK